MNAITIMVRRTATITATITATRLVPPHMTTTMPKRWTTT